MKNMGKTDRIIRIVAGFILIAAGIVLQATTGGLWWIGILGLVFLGTSIMGFCPLYLPFGINTGSKS